MPDLFRGIVNREAKDSTPWWPEPNRPDKNLPNIVTALLDDTGRAQALWERVLEASSDVFLDGDKSGLHVLLLFWSIAS